MNAKRALRHAISSQELRLRQQDPQRVIAHVGLAKTPRKRPHQRPGTMERVKGIEPSYEAWEAAVLPLNYARAVLRLTLNSRGRAKEEALGAAAIISW